jgi:hypothetical protein
VLEAKNNLSDSFRILAGSFELRSAFNFSEAKYIQPAVNGTSNLNTLTFQRDQRCGTFLVQKGYWGRFLEIEMCREAEVGPQIPRGALDDRHVGSIEEETQVVEPHEY